MDLVGVLDSAAEKETTAMAEPGRWISASDGDGVHRLRLGFKGCGRFIAGGRRGGQGVAGGTDGDW
jgi:hypothetical protein